jgi:uroporphyrinogen-III synthase
VARRAGFSAYVAGRDAAELLGTLRATERGPFLVVRGQDAAADIAAAFREAGREASEAIVYAQEPRPLPPRALRLLAGAGAVVLPVFSARSGALLAEAARGAHARLMIAAISPAAARPLDLLRPARTLCAETPTAAGVLDAVAMLVGAGDKTP